MILCDLPYGITKNPEDKRIPFDLLWEQYTRIIKDTGVIALFAQGIFFIDLVCSNRKMFRYDLIWDKVLSSGFLNANRMPLRRHEHIAIFYKKKPTYNPQMVMGDPSHIKGKKRFNKQIVNNNYCDFKQIEDKSLFDREKKYPSSILCFPKPHPSIMYHPTEKSIKLNEWLIRTYTNEGDTVMDNCMGSGTTGIACINTNRNFIGMEKNAEHFGSAITRINEVLSKVITIKLSEAWKK